MGGQQSQAGWTMQGKIGWRDSMGWVPRVVMVIVGTLAVPRHRRGPKQRLEGLGRGGGQSDLHPELLGNRLEAMVGRGTDRWWRAAGSRGRRC